jgi:ABC-type transport system involved in cytochrome c biogenesis permease component
MVLVGLVVEWRRYDAQGEMDPWFVGALLMGLLMGFCALTLPGRPRRVAGIASLYLLLGTPVLLFVGAVAQAAGWT